jgi:SnoaL-like domain
VPDADVVREALQRWKAGIDAHEPERVSQVFSEDAIFQGLRPYSVGRQGVVDYYASQPVGMTVEYQILQTRRLSATHVLGYVRADFTFPDHHVVGVFLGMVVTHSEQGGSIVYYQASRLD